MTTATEILEAKEIKITELTHVGSGDDNLGDIAKAAIAYKKSHPDEEVVLVDGKGDRRARITINLHSTSRTVVDDMLQRGNDHVRLFDSQTIDRFLEPAKIENHEGKPITVLLPTGSSIDRSNKNIAKAALHYAQKHKDEKVYALVSNLAGPSTVYVNPDYSVEQMWDALDTRLQRIYAMRFPEDVRRDRDSGKAR